MVTHDPAASGAQARPAHTQLIVVSGLSGSGKSVAMRTLEDLRYYCVDNLPAALVPAFVQAVAAGPADLHPRLAVGVDVRNRTQDLNRLPEILAELARIDIDYRVIFFDARDEVLLKRYSETRRRHPLSADGLGLADAIAQERDLLKPMRAIADHVVDTSDLNVHQLRRIIITEMGLTQGWMTLLFESFAYRRGVPPEDGDSRAWTSTSTGRVPSMPAKTALPETLPRRSARKRAEDRRMARPSPVRGEAASAIRRRAGRRRSDLAPFPHSLAPRAGGSVRGTRPARPRPCPPAPSSHSAPPWSPGSARRA